jgi:uncharacterized membrane protein
LGYGVKRDEVIKRHSDFSGQLSAQCRTLSAGILAFTWALLTKEDSPIKTGTGLSGHKNLVGIATLVILVLVMDGAQYYAGLKVQELCLKKMGTRDTATCNHTFWDGLQHKAFHGKLLGLGFAVLWLLAYLVYLLK